MATAIESYAVDNAWFPPHTAVRDLMIKGDRVPADVPFGTTFRRYTDSSQSMSLTTPIAYLGGSPLDPFALPLRGPFRYYANVHGFGWILASFGPDADWREGGDIEFDDATIAAIYPPYPQPSPSSMLLTGAGRRGATRMIPPMVFSPKATSGESGNSKGDPDPLSRPEDRTRALRFSPRERQCVGANAHVG